jgi:hypothetical protein
MRLNRLGARAAGIKLISFFQESTSKFKPLAVAVAQITMDIKEKRQDLFRYLWENGVNAMMVVRRVGS